MLICLSITQILGHIYSIVDADLYTIHEEMLTLVEQHIIRKKCSLKSNKIKRLSNLNFLAWSKRIWKYKIIKSRVTNLRYEHRQNFNVYIKIAMQKQATLDLPWILEGEKASEKPSNYLAMQEKSYEPRLVNTVSLFDFHLKITILWPRRPRRCDRYKTTVINTSLSFHIRVSKSPQAKHYIFTKAKHKNQNGRSNEVALKVFEKTRIQALHVIEQNFTSSEWHICIFCPIAIVVSTLRVSETKNWLSWPIKI